MSVKIKVDKRLWDRKKAELTKKIQNAQPVFDKIADGEIRDAKTRIRTSKMDPDGNRWAPWSYNTMKTYANGGGGSLLYKTGMLYRSFTKKVTSKSMEVKNTAPYAGYLQNGTYKMQARAFLGFSDGSVRRVKSLFKKFLKI